MYQDLTRCNTYPYQAAYVSNGITSQKEISPTGQAFARMDRADTKSCDGAIRSAS